MFRPATNKDFDFIFELVRQGAKEGHFDRRIHESASAENGFGLELSSILEKGKRLNGLIAQPLIKEHENKAAGFLIMSAGPGNKGNELWMASLSPEFRGKGIGKKMIEEITNQFIGKNMILMARCARESEVMFSILLKHGFSHVDTGEDGTRGLLFNL